ncbi:MAG: PQQ-binding-like beta-propeller repeat protein [Alphaproteobacteria bacterium]|nr:PQQ-binding-like beta-propeller repeat protein [Alphaproteobacteria bacterium]
MLALLLTLVACGPPTCSEKLDSTDWFAEYEEPAADSWPQYRREVRHRGVAHPDVHLSSDLTETWRTEAMAIGSYTASKSSPTVAGGQVYVGVDDGRLYALDQDDGDVLWSFETHQVKVEDDRADDDPDHRGIHGTAAVADGRVFIGDYSGWLYALDAKDGALLWEIDLGGSIGASPVLYQGMVFVSVEFPDPDGKVFMVDQADGCVVWESEYLGNHPHSSTTIDPDTGTLFVGANNGRFAAFDFVEGDLVWEVWMEDVDEDGVGDEIKSTAAVSGDRVYITSWDKRLHVYDIDDGSELWSFETGASSMSSPSVYGDVVYVGSHDGRLYALADGDQDFDDDQDRELWHWQAEQRILSSATVLPGDDTVLIGSDSGEVALLDRLTGLPLWEHRAEGRASSVPTAVGDALYVYDGAGVTWRFDP